MPYATQSSNRINESNYVMDFMSALTIVKQTIDITKDLRSIDEKIDAATWKLKLSEIIDKLIEAKDALIDEKERQSELKAEIERLRVKLADRGQFEDEAGLLFKLNEVADRSGEPFCNQCFVKEDKLFRLVFGPYAGGAYRCNNCNGVFGDRDKCQHQDMRSGMLRQRGRD